MRRITAIQYEGTSSRYVAQASVVACFAGAGYSFKDMLEWPYYPLSVWLQPRSAYRRARPMRSAKDIK